MAANKNITGITIFLMPLKAFWRLGLGSRKRSPDVEKARGHDVQRCLLPHRGAKYHSRSPKRIFQQCRLEIVHRKLCVHDESQVQRGE
jgi:hypothetical protein